MIQSYISIFNFYSYGGVQQASRIAGQRKKPSQSPSMRLLGMLHVHDDPDGNTNLTNILYKNENQFYWLQEAYYLQKSCFTHLAFFLQLICNLAKFLTLHSAQHVLTLEPVSEFHASSKEYTGDQGRFMPPRLGQPFPGSSGNYQRSLSSQL